MTFEHNLSTVTCLLLVWGMKTTLHHRCNYGEMRFSKILLQGHQMKLMFWGCLLLHIPEHQ